MSRYIPFLKAKRGELTAMGELSPEVKKAICPFFDFPRKKTNYDPDTHADTAQSIATSLKKHWGSDEEFYFDDLDINQKFTLPSHRNLKKRLEIFSRPATQQVNEKPKTSNRVQIQHCPSVLQLYSQPLGA